MYFFVFAWRCLNLKAEKAPPNWRTVDKGRASDRLSRLLTETWDVLKKVWFIRKTRCAFRYQVKSLLKVTPRAL